MSERGLSPGEGALLTADLGHSTLDLRWLGASGTHRVRLTGAVDCDALLAERPAARAAGLSVVPGGLDGLEQALARRGVRLLVAGRDLECPLELAYALPETLGTDRWVAAFAARERFGDAVVVDCGTAVTVDAVTRDGRFLGGAIAPGLLALADGLAARAPRLPRFDGRPPVALPPVGSLDAVRAGVALGAVALVEGLARRIAAAAGLEHAVRVVTGGDAAWLLAEAAEAFVPVPELVHDGLAALAERVLRSVPRALP